MTHKLPTTATKGEPYTLDGYTIMVRRLGNQVQFVNRTPEGDFPHNQWVDWMATETWQKGGSRWDPGDGTTKNVDGTTKNVSAKTDRLELVHLKRRTT